MNHIPGPWTIRNWDDGHIDIVRQWDTEIHPKTAEVFGSVSGAHIADLDYTHNGVATEEQALANATLIAAAPDLLAACEMAVEELGEPADWKDVGLKAHQQLLTAIAKAKGEADV